LVPVTALRKLGDARKAPQNGATPNTRSREGRKIATVAIVAPSAPLGGTDDTAPR